MCECDAKIESVKICEIINKSASDCFVGSGNRIYAVSVMMRKGLEFPDFKCHQLSK